MLERTVVNLETSSIPEIKSRINQNLFDEFAGTVQTGPFKGMKILIDEFWKDGNLGPKILGCYEQELHQFFEEEIERLSKMDEVKIVNIGCAEGFYAVGLSRRLPNASTWIVDFPEALKIAHEAARVNDVTLRSGDLAETMVAPDFVVCDCEGAEAEYLDKEKFPDLERSTVVVEVHNEMALKSLFDRFRDSHVLVLMRESWRDPNQYQVLQPLHSTARWLAVSEGRPCMMIWLLMRPR